MSGVRLSEKHGVNPCIPKCFICGEQKNEIAFLGKLKGDIAAPITAVINYDPCDKCASVMKKGITFMECNKETGPTGRIVVLKEEAVRNMLSGNALEEALKRRVAHMEPEVYQKVFGDVGEVENV